MAVLSRCESGCCTGVGPDHAHAGLGLHEFMQHIEVAILSGHNFLEVCTVITQIVCWFLFFLTCVVGGGVLIADGSYISALIGGCLLAVFALMFLILGIYAAIRCCSVRLYVCCWCCYGCFLCCRLLGVLGLLAGCPNTLQRMGLLDL